MPSRTLRVPETSSRLVDAERRGRHPHAERGNEAGGGPVEVCEESRTNWDRKEAGKETPALSFLPVRRGRGEIGIPGGSPSHRRDLISEDSHGRLMRPYAGSRRPFRGKPPSAG